MGLQAGDLLVSINGHRLRDVIDYRFYGADERLEVEYERAGERLVSSVERRYGEELGLHFSEDVFDGLRRCGNRCAFCFVDQMPPGLRPSLYVKDDDYRYSFLHGSFITLSNLTEEDWERVAEQHLSPLYVSVHATDADLRRQLFCNPRLPDVLDRLRRLADIGIDVHTQIVVIPGLNDGDQLERTVRDLAALFPTVRSIGVVPVGLTKYHAGGVRLLAADEEREVLESVIAWQKDYRRELGTGLVYGADELYLRVGHPIPATEEYDGFPQLENGIGLVRQLLDGWDSQRRRFPTLSREGKATLVCGVLIEPVLQSIAVELGDRAALDISIRSLENKFFGSSVTVSGLLTARDVVRALEGEHWGDVVFVPRAMFDADGRVTLDEMTIEEVATAIGVPVVCGTGVKEIVDYFGADGCGCAAPGGVI